MNDQQKTLAAVTIIIGFFAIILLIILAVVSSKRIVSPIPEDSAIKIIFVSPTPTPLTTIMPSATVKMTPVPKE